MVYFDVYMYFAGFLQSVPVADLAVKAGRYCTPALFEAVLKLTPREPLVVVHVQHRHHMLQLPACSPQAVPLFSCCQQVALSIKVAAASRLPYMPGSCSQQVALSAR